MSLQSARWPTTTLGDLCSPPGGELQTGPFGSQLHASDYVPVGTPLVMPRDLANGEIDPENAARISDDDAERLAQHRLRPRDLVFSRRGDVGRFAIVADGQEGWICGTGCLRARLGDDRLHPRFVHWWLSTPLVQRWFKDNAQGATMPNLNTTILSRVPMVVPPLPEQRRIAAILDEADALRRKRREALGLLDELLRSAFLEMFGDPVTNPRGWETVALGRLAEVQGGLQVTSKRAELPVEVPYLRVANVYRDRVDLQEIKTIRATQAEVDRVRLRVGDVLVVEGHGNPDELGRCAVWTEAGEYVHQNHLIRVRPNEARLRPAYLSAFINSDGGRRQMLRAGKTTSGLNTISTANVKATRILLPPLGLQRRWEDLVAAQRAQASAVGTHATRLDALFEALLHRAFTGPL